MNITTNRPRARHRIRAILAASALSLALAAPLPAAATGEVNVYSARKEELIRPLLERFTAATGIAVNLVTGNADGLLMRLSVEGDLSPADVFITVDAGRLHRAKEAEVLRRIESKVLNEIIPEPLRDDDGYWYGLSKRARTIIYAKDRASPADFSTYEALADSKWKNRLCIRGSNNIYNQSLVASLIDTHGEEQTEAWARAVVANFAQPPRGGDTDQLKAVAAGVCDATLVNTYYFGRMLESDDPKVRAQAAKLAVYWPNQDGRGVHVNVSGAGVTRASKNPDNAVKLLEFLVSPQSQAWYAEVNHEYPVVPGAEISDTLRGFGSFNSDDISLSRLGENNRAALKIMDRAGWK